MKMPVEKARKVLKDFGESNFNQKETLLKSGYKESTATKQSRKVINTAIKTVAREDIESIVSSSNPMGTLLQRVGITREQLIGEYLKIILQDKDMSNKLKAMMPLLKPEGIIWNEEQTTNAPTLNLTVKQNIDAHKPIVAGSEVITDVVGQQPSEPELLQSNTMAQQSDEKDVAQSALYDVTSTENNDVIKEGGGVDSSSIPLKEGDSRIPKISEIGTIDLPR